MEWLRPLRGALPRLAVLLASASVAGAFFFEYCALLYGCGCVSAGAGGAAFCNIQIPGPPDCPLCAFPSAAEAALGGTILTQGAVLFWPGPPGLLARTLAALAAFPAVVGAVGAALGLFVGYWT